MKRIGIYFILLANIILLAHAIVPHHHHDGAVAIAYGHHDGELLHPDVSCHSHDCSRHPNSSHKDGCAIHESFTIAMQRDHRVDFDDHHQLANLLFILPLQFSIKPRFTDFVTNFGENEALFILNDRVGDIARRGPPRKSIA